MLGDENGRYEANAEDRNESDLDDMREDSFRQNCE